MAIDTAFERRMAATIKPIHKVPAPDSIIDIYDRVHIAWLYGALIPITADTALHAQKRLFALNAQEREFALRAQKRPFSLKVRERP